MLNTFLTLGFLFTITQAANIQWTGRGGTNLWDNALNWDCNCIPTLNDNVMIAFSLGSVSVRIGAPASAGNLVIGGSGTTFTQTLTVSGQLTVGSGTLNTNGVLSIESGPTAPFNITNGNFYVFGSGLQFVSGLIGGNGSLVVASGNGQVSFNGAAAKEVAGNLRIEGSAVINSVTGASIFVREKGRFVVSGSLSSSNNLDILVDKTALFNVTHNGTFTFNAQKLLLQGPFDLGNWNVQNGQVTVVNSLTSGKLTLGNSAQLVLIGGPDEIRNLGSIKGGTIIQQGGVSSWTSLNVAGYTLTGGSAAATGETKLSLFNINGGSLNKGAVTADTTTIDFAVISGAATIRTTAFDLRGLLTLQDAGTKITVAGPGSAKISAVSQITFLEGTSLTIESGAQVTQSASLKLVKGAASGVAPALAHSGSWSSTADFATLGVPVTGRGSFTVQSATFDFTNADFSADSVNSQGIFALNQGNFDINTVQGAGTFIGAPKSFTSVSFSVGNLTVVDGTFTLTKANAAKASFSNGIVQVGSAQFGSLNFIGGSLAGAKAGAPVTVQTLVFSDVPAKTLANVAVTATSLSLSCGNAQCALFTTSATLSTSK